MSMLSDVSRSDADVGLRIEGSILIEALVGITLLALVGGSIATMVPAAVDARARAHSQRLAVASAESALEFAMTGLPPAIDEAVGDGPGADLPADVDTPAELGAPRTGRCDPGGDETVTPLRVRVQHGGRSPGREVVLLAHPTDRSGTVAPSEAPTTLTVWAPDDAVDLSGLLLVAGDGESTAPVAVGPGCARFEAPGTGAFSLEIDDTHHVLVDRSHVALSQRPVPVTLGDRRGERLVDHTSAAWVSVAIEAHGARLPDVVSGGSLRWLVRGDDARTAHAIGSARPVHPGGVTVVVTACDEAESTASTLSVRTEPGEHVTAVVPLAVVVVENLRGHADGRLEFMRTTGCLDGSGLRPEVRFVGALHDGMRVALPRGEWTASLWIPGGGYLPGTVRFVTQDVETAVRFP